jgi:antitoxin (DNA-binding transcriptional repressor) of toxin-antitoxin stability system
VIITQRGRPVALLVNYKDYEGMVATLEEISQPDWRERLAEAERDSKARKGKCGSSASLISHGSLKNPSTLRPMGRVPCTAGQKPRRKRDHF